MRLSILLPASLLVIPFLCIQAADPVIKPVIKLVSSLPRTGSANAQTTTIVNGIRLALKESGDVVAGCRIEYEDWDDASPERGQWDRAADFDTRARVEAHRWSKLASDGLK